jgi:hypothetical protein
MPFLSIFSIERGNYSWPRTAGNGVTERRPRQNQEPRTRSPRQNQEPRTRSRITPLCSRTLWTANAIIPGKQQKRCVQNWLQEKATSFTFCNSALPWSYASMPQARRSCTHPSYLLLRVPDTNIVQLQRVRSQERTDIQTFKRTWRRQTLQDLKFSHPKPNRAIVLSNMLGYTCHTSVVGFRAYLNP